VTQLRKTCLALAALAGFASVLAAAYATHALANPQASEWMRIGASCALEQGLAVFAAVFVASHGGRQAMAAAVLFLVGILLFCGSLWAVALGAPKALAMATPVGGLCFMAGWLALAWACLSLRKPG
jgi:uncharacterized membrane protein YgdD (TMEM256/DUF423 family)